MFETFWKLKLGAPSLDTEPFSGIHHHALLRRHRAQSLPGTRSHAMKIWGDIKSGQGNQPELIELAIASLSSFFAYSPAEVRRHRCFPGLSHILILAGKITRQVEALAQECRAYLIRNRISVDPSEEHLERISLAIYEFVWEKGFRLAERTFHPNSQSPRCS